MRVIEQGAHRQKSELGKQADSAQRSKWLEQMDGVCKRHGPLTMEASHARVFLLCLASLLEPELPLS